jgi:hypothetical protein
MALINIGCGKVYGMQTVSGEIRLGFATIDEAIKASKVEPSRGDLEWFPFSYEDHGDE